MQRVASSPIPIRWLITLTVVCGLLAVAPPSHADGARLLSVDAAAAAAEETSLESEVVPPEKVFIQKTSQFPQYGNVLVMVELSAEAQAEKAAEGKEFINLGEEDAQILARDDGKGGDATAGDGLFTAIAYVDDAQMQERSDDDDAALAKKGNSSEVVFDGRVETGTRTVSAFDAEGFLAGRRVELDTAIVALDPEPKTVKEQEPIPVAATAPLQSVQGASFHGTTTFQDRVLMIRDTGVVQDPTRTWNPCDGSGNANGVWTFNHLMTAMANQPATGIHPGDFVENWLKNWVTPPGPINSFTVSTRSQMQVIIDNWRADSGGGQLDLSKAPLRLLAIVPRLDLRRTTGGGGGYGGNVSGNFLDAGEARFVFGFVAPPQWGSNLGFIAPVEIGGHPGCDALPFTVILEYRVPKCDCFDVRDWARSWVDLRNHTPGTAAYNDRLERLTETFARRNADPTRPNGSAIGQVRTNEVALPQNAPVSTIVWELREFQLTMMPWSLLNETTTADTPHDTFNAVSPLFGGSQLLFDWIQVVKGSTNQPPVPLLFQGSAPSAQNFLGTNPQVPEANPAVITYHWNHPLVTHPADNQARFDVSVAACSGCHRGDTGTPFLHVDPANAATNAVLPAPISGFLSGINWADPAFGVPTRHFDDLKRREKDIKKLSKVRCFRFHPIHVQHVKNNLKNGGGLPDDLFGGEPPVPVDQRPALGVDDMRRNPVDEVH